MSSQIEWSSGAAWRYFAFKLSLSVNSGRRLVELAEAGFGLTWMPDFLTGEALRAGRLVQVLPRLRWEVRDVAALYVPALRHKWELKLFLAELRRHVAGGAVGPAAAPAGR